MKDLTQYSELEDLITKKEFVSLTNNETEFVLSLISETEYKNIRGIISVAKQIKSKEIISEIPDEKNQLIMAFDKTHSSEEKTILRKIVVYSLPVYKVVAGMLLILSLSYLINMKFFPASHDRIVYLTDTIYKEVLVPESIWLADSSTRSQYFGSNKNHFSNQKQHQLSEKNVSINNDIENYINTDMTILARHVGLISDRDLIDFRRKKIKGKTLSEDSMLRQFMVVVN